LGKSVRKPQGGLLTLYTAELLAIRAALQYISK